MIHLRRAAILVALCIVAGTLATGPVQAIDGERLITHSKALAGDVTPGDTAGYPVTLSLPGIYKFASNLAPGTGQSGIIVTVPDVTIDLNGFRLSGGPAGGANNARIGIDARADRLTVKNGTIGAFTMAGVWAILRHYLVVENMRIIHVAGSTGFADGINADQGRFARIQNNTIALNIGDGIRCGEACHVEGNMVSGNGGFGVLLASGTVLGNTILSNGNFGIDVVRETPAGFGNNTVINNNAGGAQLNGPMLSLHPNACAPVAC